MAAIHKRRVRSGEVVWELTHGTGKDRQRFIAGRSKDEAQETLRQFNRQLALHGDAPTNDSLGSVIGEYAKYLKTNRRSNTMSRYLRVLRTFDSCFLRRFFPDVERLRQLRPMHIEEFKRLRADGLISEEKTESEGLREQELRLELAQERTEKLPREKRGKYGWLGRHGIRAKVSPKTINYELQALATFFSWSIKRNHLFINPAAQIERFRVPKRALPKFMTSEELRKFFGACREDDRRLFMSILLTGMRKGEVEHLTWADISFELGVIFIQEKPEFGWKPKTDERLIPISPMLQEVLLQQYAMRRSDKLVFPNDSGNRDTHILERLKLTCARAGIRLSTVHALRHSFGAHLRMAGASLADIGDLLGHADLATTQIYAKVQQEHLRAVISRLKPLIAEVEGEDKPGRLLPDARPHISDDTTQ
jgi:site-specific recombinase XerD